MGIKKQAVTNRPSKGDILEFKVSGGFAYAQYINDTKKFGVYIRVFKGVYEKRPDVELILNLPEQFQIFFLLDFELKNENVTVIGNYTIPPASHDFPLFKSYNDTQNGRMWFLKYMDDRKFPKYEWFASDCKNLKKIGFTLPLEYYDLPVCDLVGYRELALMIKKGWTNESAVHINKSSQKDIDQSDVSKIEQSKVEKKTTNQRGSRRCTANPIKESLIQLLDRLDSIAQSHEEICDTDVRESIFQAIWKSFVVPEKNYQLPNDFGFFSKSGNRKVFLAMKKFLSCVNDLIRSQPQSKHWRARLNMLQDDSVESNRGSTYDDYFGCLDKKQ